MKTRKNTWASHVFIEVAEILLLLMFAKINQECSVLSISESRIHEVFFFKGYVDF